MRTLALAICLALCATPALAQDYRLQTAAASELQSICSADAGQLWGASLCGPLIVVDGRTRSVWATQRDNEGVLNLTAGGGWVGTLPPGVPVANTTVEWAGVRWIMVVGPLPEDATARRVLVTHEAWHRLQASIGLPMLNVSAAHLETERGRYLMRLELRALSTAMMSNRGARRDAVKDALAFRLARHAAFPDAASQEASLDRNEGLASYTGVKLGAGDEANLFTARTLNAYDSHDAFARAYAYASGPAYGLLLDEYAPGWRATLAAYAPADLLVGQLRVRALSSRNLQRRAERYGGPQIAAEERTRAEAQRARIAALMARYRDGRVLSLPLGQFQFEFNPEAVIPVPGLGQYYEAMVLRDVWGEARATQGAVITEDFQHLILAEPHLAAIGVEGPGWTVAVRPEGAHLLPPEFAPLPSSQPPGR